MSDRQEYYNNNSDVLLPFNENEKKKLRHFKLN